MPREKACQNEVIVLVVVESKSPIYMYKCNMHSRLCLVSIPAIYWPLDSFMHACRTSKFEKFPLRTVLKWLWDIFCKWPHWHHFPNLEAWYARLHWVHAKK